MPAPSPRLAHACCLTSTATCLPLNGSLRGGFLDCGDCSGQDVMAAARAAPRQAQRAPRFLPVACQLGGTSTRWRVGSAAGASHGGRAERVSGAAAAGWSAQSQQGGAAQPLTTPGLAARALTSNKKAQAGFSEPRGRRVRRGGCGNGLSALLRPHLRAGTTRIRRAVRRYRPQPRVRIAAPPTEPSYRETLRRRRWCDSSTLVRRTDAPVCAATARVCRACSHTLLH
eukprot:363534-Chlamydomonas_euryale.AAC.5